MTTAINATQSAVTGAGTAKSNTIGKDATEDRFLKLLIAQMKNQDPLNPLDNAAVTSQMAQINTVQGISQLNSTMTTMLSQLQGSQAMSLPGHQVLIDGNGLTLAKAGAAAGNALNARAGFNLPADADQVAIEIRNAQGQVVSTLDLGAQSAGAGTFNWDGNSASGTATAGNYTFSVKASAGGAAVAAASLTAAQVIGTTNTAQGVRLTIDAQGLTGTRNYSDVRMVL